VRIGDPLEAVIFDLDGVLIDSEPVWEQVRKDYVVERGGRWTEDAQAHLLGMSTAEWARYLSADLSVNLPPDTVADEVVERMADRYADSLPLMPGADETLQRLHRTLRLALASSSPRRLIDSILVTAGWLDLFEVTVSTDEAGRGKPAPDVYLWAAGRLNLRPSACAAVEDSSNGLRSAAAAGTFVIALPHPRYPPAPDAISLAEVVLAGLTDLPALGLGSGG
jgi:HAD superfamily hydrolase (TIGR01509 family)